MRFLGPRSISSLLKTALDVVYYGLYAVIFLVLLAAVCVVVVPNVVEITLQKLNVATNLSSGSQAAMFVVYALYLVGYLMIMHWTRQVFKTLAEGDVFHPANTLRLRWIGFGLGGLEVFGYLLHLFAEGMFQLQFEPVYGLRAVTTWFSVLVVFVLAEVFKEGARLRQEADLTI